MTDPQTPAATNTVEDLEAANTLLSLGDSLEDTLEQDDDNAFLMPIGGANNLEDIAPEPIQLDQHSVDNTIAELIETEELKKSIEEDGMNQTETLLAPTDQLQHSVDNTIAELIETEELKKSIEEDGMNQTETLLAPTDQLQPSMDPLQLYIPWITVPMLKKDH